MLTRLLLAVAVALPASPVFSQQTRIAIEHSAEMQILQTPNGEERRLKGNVAFRQGDARLLCDSAVHSVKKNLLRAYGTVRIEHGDSITASGDSLHYNGNQRRAVLFGRKVTLIDPRAKLTTTRLEYDLQGKRARYKTGGVLTEKEAILSSVWGEYMTGNGMARFANDVELKHPEYLLCADSLAFDTRRRLALFTGPTTITSDKDVVYCRSGWYDERNDRALFSDSAEVKAPPQHIRADTIAYDRSRGLGRAYGHAHVTDTAEKSELYCHQVVYMQRQDAIVATGDVILHREMNKDTLSIRTDSLFSHALDTGRRLEAYPMVRFYKQNMQGFCDSLRYSDEDSTMHFIGTPVMWSDENQFSADSIRLKLKDQRISGIKMTGNCFIGSYLEEGVYNQIAGREVQGVFRSDSLRSMHVTGNVESIYYAQDEDSAYVGANQIISSDLLLKMAGGKIARITFSVQPDGKLTPMQDVRPEEFILDGFEWKGAARPQQSEFRRLP